MSSHNNPRSTASTNHQYTLWTILAWHFPASIIKTLQSTPNIHSYELHLLYSILISCQLHTPDHLFIKIHALPSRVAAEVVSALEELDIRLPVSMDRKENHSITSIGHSYVDCPAPLISCKPLFYTVEREELYSLVQRLFAAGYLGDKSDGSKRAEVHNFATLHVLYRLEAEHCRSKKYGDTELTEPSHEWYHETSDALVAQWTRYLWSLPQPVGEDEEEDDDVVIKIEPFQ